MGLKTPSHRAFTVDGLALWSLLSDNLRDPDISILTLANSKTVFFILVMFCALSASQMLLCTVWIHIDIGMVYQSDMLCVCFVILQIALRWRTEAEVVSGKGKNQPFQWSLCSLAIPLGLLAYLFSGTNLEAKNMNPLCRLVWHTKFPRSRNRKERPSRLLGMHIGPLLERPQHWWLKER